MIVSDDDGVPMDIVLSIRREIGKLWAGGKGRLLGVISIGWGLLIGTRLAFPVLLPYIRESFDLSLTVGSLLISILWLGVAVGQLPGGIIADRYSGRLAMTAGIFLTAVGLTVVIIAPTSLVLFAAVGAVGIGQSLYPIARITSLSNLYPDRIGSALGVTMATGDLGQTVLPAIVGVLAGAIVWQAGLIFLIPIFLIMGIVIWRGLPDQDSDSGTANTLSVEYFRSIFSELKRSNMVLVEVIFFLYAVIWSSFTGLYPTYLVEVKGLSTSVAGVLFSLFFAVGIMIKPLAGSAYDRFGVRSALLTVLTGPAVGFALLTVTNGFWLLVVVTALVGSMLGSGAIAQSFLTDSLSEDQRGMGLGVVRTITISLAAVSPFFFGAIADRGYFNEGYLFLSVVMVIIIFLTLRLSPD